MITLFYVLHLYGLSYILYFAFIWFCLVCFRCLDLFFDPRLLTCVSLSTLFSYSILLLVYIIIIFLISFSIATFAHLFPRLTATHDLLVRSGGLLGMVFLLYVLIWYLSYDTSMFSIFVWCFSCVV